MGDKTPIYPIVTHLHLHLTIYIHPLSLLAFTKFKLETLKNYTMKILIKTSENCKSIASSLIPFLGVFLKSKLEYERMVN